MIRKYLFTLWLIAYEQVVLDHEEKTQLILSLSMTSMDQVLETIVKNQNAIRIWVSDQINHVCDKIIPVAMHDQKNKTSPEAQVASWRGLVDQRREVQSWKLGCNQGVELQWPLVQKPWVLSNQGKEQDLSREVMWTTIHAEARAAEGIN